MGVFPSDHVISKPARYLAFVRPALPGGRSGKIVVLGIQARWPETGYGYIEFPKNVKAGSREPVNVRRFREKPDLQTARRYVKAGNFYWNAGMFFWKASVLLDALREYLPKTATLLRACPHSPTAAFAAKLKEAFPHCENISIDYAVLEKSPHVVGLATDDFGWNDVGSWNAVYELLARDADGNVFRAEALARSSSGNYVDAEGKLVALLGVKDLSSSIRPTRCSSPTARARRKSATSSRN